MNKSAPTISVLMPVYNGGLYLREAVESILNQTFGDFEFIIIDDGSTDDTPAIIDSFKDSRILYSRNEVNLGVAKTLNKGLKVARGKFIARMDADDVSLPERLEKQLNYLGRHVDVGVVGAWAQVVDKNGAILSNLQIPISHALITWSFLFDNCMIHSSVVFRRGLIEKMGGYPEDVPHGEDFELWIMMIDMTKFANISEVLVYKRVHSDAVAERFLGEQTKTRTRLTTKVISGLLNRDILKKEFSAIECIVNRRAAFESFSEVVLAVKLIKELLKKFLYKYELCHLEKKEVCNEARARIRYIGRHIIKTLPFAALYSYWAAINLYDV